MTLLRFAAALLLCLSTAWAEMPVPDVANPALHAAIERLGKERSVAAKTHLYQQLNQATYLVPLQAQGTEFAPYRVNGANGASFMAIYSDAESLALSRIEPAKVIDMEAQALWTMVLGDDNLDGVALNPARNALPLNKQRIAEIAKTH